MKSEGSGGRSFAGRNDDLSVLAGLIGGDVNPAGTHERECAHPMCENWFTARQYGDDYCSQACEFSDNPQFRGGRGGGD